MWLSDIKDYIDALLKYGDFDFVAKAFKIYNITDTRFELIRKLYHYFMIENVIDKLNKLNDSIKAKVDD